MSVGQYARKALTISPEETVRSAAQRMEKDGVGCLIVAQNDRPQGIVTDRDIALRVLRQKLDPGAVKVWEVMQRPLVHVSADAPLPDAMQTMRKHGLRRLPVVDPYGNLEGVITLDDMLRLIATELGDLAEAVRAQLAQESAAPQGARASTGGAPR